MQPCHCFRMRACRLSGVTTEPSELPQWLSQRTELCVLPVSSGEMQIVSAHTAITKTGPPHIPPSWTGLIWTWTKKWAKSANLPASPDQLNLLQCCQCCSLLSIRHSTPDPEVIPCPPSVPEIVRASCLWVEHGENKTGGVMVRCWGPTLMKGRNSSRDVSLTGVQRTIFAPLQLWSTNCHGLIITCVGMRTSLGQTEQVPSSKKSGQQFNFWRDLRPPFRVKRMQREVDDGHADGPLFRITYCCPLDYVTERKWGHRTAEGSFENLVHGVAEVRIPKDTPWRVCGLRWFEGWEGLRVE